MSTIYIPNILESCDKVASKITNLSSCRLFDACMRAFTGTPKAPTAAKGLAATQ